MALRVPVAHDFTCGWCWIGLHQIRRLRREFDLEFEWLAYELYPEGLIEPPSPPRPEPDPRRPATPGRFALALAAEGLEPLRAELPAVRSTRYAHQAVEYCKRFGGQDEMVDRLYRAYWIHGIPIDDLQSIGLLATGLAPDVASMIESLRDGFGASEIVEFTEPANAQGVFNLPTYWIGGERYAEQPIGVLRKALSQVAEAAPLRGIYEDLDFPSAPAGRPTVLINMVATIDGKTTSGERDSHVMDLGSEMDHQVMRTIESAVDAVMIGAGTLRATPRLWYDKRLIRCVVTRSGNLDPTYRFFTDAPDRAIVIGPRTMAPTAIDGVHEIRQGEGDADLSGALKALRDDYGVNRLLVEGGSDLNAALLRLDLVDELFLTIAPKVKLGTDVPTYAGGAPLPGREMRDFTLVEHNQVGDELFLRYRRKR